jgi:hypothetical protein
MSGSHTQGAGVQARMPDQAMHDGLIEPTNKEGSVASSSKLFLRGTSRTDFGSFGAPPKGAPRARSLSLSLFLSLCLSLCLSFSAHPRGAMGMADPANYHAAFPAAASAVSDGC